MCVNCNCVFYVAAAYVRHVFLEKEVLNLNDLSGEMKVESKTLGGKHRSPAASGSSCSISCRRISLRQWTAPPDNVLLPTHCRPHSRATARSQKWDAQAQKCVWPTWINVLTDCYTITKAMFACSNKNFKYNCKSDADTFLVSQKQSQVDPSVKFVKCPVYMKSCFSLEIINGN